MQLKGSELPQLQLHQLNIAFTTPKVVIDMLVAQDHPHPSHSAATWSLSTKNKTTKHLHTTMATTREQGQMLITTAYEECINFFRDSYICLDLILSKSSTEIQWLSEVAYFGPHENSMANN